MELKLSQDERSLLVRLLEEALGDMRVEVRRTSTPSYHDRLQADARLLQEVLGRLQAA